MNISKQVGQCMMRARALAETMGHEYITPEHVLYVLCEDEAFLEAFEECGGDGELLQDQIEEYLHTYIEMRDDVEAMESFSLQEALIYATQQVVNSGRDTLTIDHLLAGIMSLKENHGVYYILSQEVTKQELLFELCHQEDRSYEQSHGEHEEVEEVSDEMRSEYLVDLMTQKQIQEETLIGREDILERTLQILCRKQKNNPIHIGESGVGKTAITRGLVKRIQEGNVPEILVNAKVFELDLGGMLAGTQYRGDFEKRIKKVFDGLKQQDQPIVYIDEIHNIVGAGALGQGALDAANLLKPYLTEGKIRFIGATTFEEYKKYFEKNKSLVRRFQTIEVKEPTVEETLKILQGLKASYENYHHVTYTNEALEAAVTLSHQYINDRFLPDKAIDIIDEAGSFMAMQESKKKVIKPALIEEVIAKVCQIPKQSVEVNERTKLKQLEKNLKQNVFGQNQAVEEVVNCIKMSRAGLSDGNKPVASMLFVGPTGVGKTELAKELAHKLGVKLIRFDMSEYTEKHTASKLIGSPPGYVGYEEGGLLTDAIRQTPHCILLLDEIEKAHSDIFNMLLQVMDYATLTDSHGKKADFRNVILLMTSNAGASQIGKSLVGFGERMIQGSAIMEEVKKVFTPEFRNRLNGVVVFNHLDEEMGVRIAKKALTELQLKLAEKNVKMSFTKKCIEQVARTGTSKEFGAREIARVVEHKIKPLFVDEVLFGKLAHGGNCKLNYNEEQFKIEIE